LNVTLGLELGKARGSMEMHNIGCRQDQGGCALAQFKSLSIQIFDGTLFRNFLHEFLHEVSILIDPFVKIEQNCVLQQCTELATGDDTHPPNQGNNVSTVAGRSAWILPQQPVSPA
jgi:hypothetical protein